MIKNLLFNDFVVQYNHCNFACEYCLNKLKPDETDIWKATNSFHIPSYSELKSSISEYSGILKQNIIKTMSNCRKAIDTPILRLSGGEILGIKGIKQLLKEACEQYHIVQIVTNGYYLDYNMSEYLKSLKKIHIHFSVDGHTNTLNYYRVKDYSIQRLLMENLHNCIVLGIPVEISSVLTNRNTKEYETFLQYLMQYSENTLKVFPAPVRGMHSAQYFPTINDIEQFSLIMQRYEQYKKLLPPKAYMDNLLDFLFTREKRSRCCVPLAAIQSLDNGTLTACPNGWTSQITNVCFDDTLSVIKKIEKENIYSIFTQKRPRLKYCKECFSAYEIINLYFNDEITEEELRTIPLYCSDEVRKRLCELKENDRGGVTC